MFFSKNGFRKKIYLKTIIKFIQSIITKLINFINMMTTASIERVHTAFAERINIIMLFIYFKFETFCFKKNEIKY